MELTESPNDGEPEQPEEVGYDATRGVEDSSKNKRLCSSCKSPIHIDAKKCSSCGSFQDWRRHVVLSNTLLALLIALISVSATLGPTIAEFFRPIESNLHVTVVEVARDAIKVVAGNVGTRPGIISNAKYLFGNKNRYQERELVIEGEVYATIPRDTLQTLSLYPTISGVRAPLIVGGTKCSLSIEFIEFGGNTIIEMFEIPCIK